MKTLSILLPIMCTLLHCTKDDGDGSVKKMAEVRGYKNWYIDDFRCGLFVPESYSADKSYPLIIFLHGRSDTTTWDLAWYNEPLSSLDPAIVLTPKCPPEDINGWGHSYNNNVSPALAKTYEMLKRVESTFNVDTNRLYIYGSSMGGFGTLAVIRQNPGKFAAGYIECGNGSTSMACTLAQIPFWMFHGSEDPIVPVGPTRDLYKKVTECGGTHIRYTEYEGVMHNVWDYTRHESTLKTWFLAQHKGADHSRPTPVSGFDATETEGKVKLIWNVPKGSYPPSDNDIWFCRIYRGGQIIKEIYNDESSYVDSTVLSGNPYSYQVSVMNYYFMESPLSDPLVVNIP